METGRGRLGNKNTRRLTIHLLLQYLYIYTLDHLYHESMIMHGVQTTEEPLLAMFIWWGDVTPAQWCTKCIKCTE